MARERGGTSGLLPAPGLKPRKGSKTIFWSAWSLGFLFSLALIATVAASAAPSEEGQPSLRQTEWPGASLFLEPPHRIQIEVSPHDLEHLREDAREFVPATVRDGGTIYSNVAIHLKGAVGSFRPVEDKPAWTLDFSRMNSGQKFQGLRRIHLNNSVEDPSYCNEWLGNELFRRAGLPAPRVAHALVTLNGRRLGLYVLKEGFTEDFLSCYFKRVGGGLYEPGEGHDVNQRLKRNSVRAARGDGGELKKLAEAVLSKEEPRHRWPALEAALDTNQFVSFMALEVMLCHRDGYCLARNNFRVYEDLDSGKVQFFPHGMDQLFGSPELPWKPNMSGLVARTLMETPEGARLYQDRFADLFARLFQVELLQGQVERILANLEPLLTDSEFAQVKRAAAEVETRMAARHLSLKKQLAEPPRKLLGFSNGIAFLNGWTAEQRPDKGTMDRTNAPDGKPALEITTQSETSSCWQTKAILNRGRYEFRGQAMVSGVKPLSSGSHQGAGLRIAGQTRQSAGVIGDSPWSRVAAPFVVDRDGTEIEFLCELRAAAGSAWFDLDSLQIVQLQ